MQMALYFFYLCLFYACYVCLLKTSFVITNCSSPDLWPWWKFKFGPSNVDFENPCYRQTHTRVNLWTSRNIGLIESARPLNCTHVQYSLPLHRYKSTDYFITPLQEHGCHILNRKEDFCEYWRVLPSTASEKTVQLSLWVTHSFWMWTLAKEWSRATHIAECSIEKCRNNKCTHKAQRGGRGCHVWFAEARSQQRISETFGSGSASGLYWVYFLQNKRNMLLILNHAQTQQISVVV